MGEGEEGNYGHGRVEYEIDGTFKRVGFGYDYTNRVDLYWGDLEDVKGDMRVYKLI